MLAQVGDEQPESPEDRKECAVLLPQDADAVEQTARGRCRVDLIEGVGRQVEDVARSATDDEELKSSITIAGHCGRCRGVDDVPELPRAAVAQQFKEVPTRHGKDAAIERVQTPDGTVAECRKRRGARTRTVVDLCLPFGIRWEEFGIPVDEPLRVRDAARGLIRRSDELDKDDE